MVILTDLEPFCKSTAHEPRTYRSCQGLTTPKKSEPSPLDRFLGIAYRKQGHTLRKSTYIIGVTLFYMLREGPSIVNYSQLARDTGYSRPVIYRALAYFSRFGKVSRTNERRTGKRRPCEYKLHDSFTEKQEAPKPQEKGRCEFSVNSHSIKSKDINPTKARIELLKESFNRIPRQNPLTERQKRTGAFLIRFERKRGLVSGLVDSLWQRDCVAGVWQDVSTGLQGLGVGSVSDGRARTAIKALVQGATVKAFRAIMQDEPANEEEASKREVAEIDRRLQGLRKWGARHGCTSWFVEKRAELEKERYKTEPREISVDGFFKTFTEPQPQRTRAKRFEVSRFYTSKRTVLDGEALEKRKASAVKALNQGRNSGGEGVEFDRRVSIGYNSS